MKAAGNGQSREFGDKFVPAPCAMQFWAFCFATLLKASIRVTWRMIRKDVQESEAQA